MGDRSPFLKFGIEVVCVILTSLPKGPSESPRSLNLLSLLCDSSVQDGQSNWKDGGSTEE
jgi:hypothetical protein